MEMTGSQLIPRAREVVWAGLNDAEMLRACIPGCESLQRVSDTEYRALIVVAVGPIKSKFTGKLLLLDIDAPHSYRMTFEGSSGAAGTAKGGAQISLASEGAGTRLTYVAKAQVGGKLAQVGSRLIDGVAKKMADEFFERFNACIAGPGVVHATEGVVPSTSSPSSYVKWAIAAAVVVGVVVLWFALH
jgi:carbon monoxide dehydrogenase subunit G